jgi:threonyl-tRNA synthetase
MVESGAQPSDDKTPREILQAQGKLTRDVVAARVVLDQQPASIWDLHTPVPAGASVEPITVADPEALQVIRHSTAHVMADAVQRLYPGTKVTFGPAIDNGFYYDFDRKDGQFTEEDFAKIEAAMKEIIAADTPFRREVIEKDDARALLRSMGETYKVEHLERLEGEISLYRHGNWVDLCEGPHVPSTGFLRAVKLTSVAGAYWRGDERNPMLQRIYGTAFPSQKELDAYLAGLEEAKKRDHRKLGTSLELFGFHRFAPASPFFLPRGTDVYNRLNAYVRDLYLRHGYSEVITPQVFDRELFETSGHLPEYAENMFFAATRESIEHSAELLAKKGPQDAAAIQKDLEAGMRFSVKPMNCPGHCVMFDMTRRSYRELPMRIADFGRLHRFERSGVVQGLTRVRTFSQDDAHIFCTIEQVQGEMVAFLDLVHDVYKDFGFSEVRVKIATRPAARLGSDEVWDQSEKALINAVEHRKLPYEIAEGEGAFYGPKIEFHLKDALQRSWQLGTIQVDFNLPERFDLTYVAEDNTQKRPVMLHRAVLGSIERFFAVLVEHVAGAFPTWLSPEQVAILTVSEKVNDYAMTLKAQLEAAGVRAIADVSSDKLGAKIRNARMMRIPYLAVVGAREAEQGGGALRSRDEDKDLGFMTTAQIIERVNSESLPPSRRAI